MNDTPRLRAYSCVNDLTSRDNIVEIELRTQFNAWRASNSCRIAIICCHDTLEDMQKHEELLPLIGPEGTYSCDSLLDDVFTILKTIHTKESDFAENWRSVLYETLAYVLINEFISFDQLAQRAGASLLVRDDVTWIYQLLKALHYFQAVNLESILRAIPKYFHEEHALDLFERILVNSRYYTEPINDLNTRDPNVAFLIFDEIFRRDSMLFYDYEMIKMLHYAGLTSLLQIRKVLKATKLLDGEAKRVIRLCIIEDPYYLNCLKKESAEG